MLQLRISKSHFVHRTTKTIRDRYEKQLKQLIQELTDKKKRLDPKKTWAKGNHNIAFYNQKRDRGERLKP